MPPRKRAASAPKADPEQEPAVIEADEEAPPNEADGSTAELVPGDPEDADADEEQEPKAGEPEGDEPERSDLQTAEQPCAECCPNGWPEGAFSVGCTHGTWVRKQD
ncbi:hypothetical protein AB0N99_30925 [Streptomyces sp. NPDC093272]|uniref:hypothetical protein n=1 Tax=Streptomyces sp. NPDC093272 TaxID=3154981 RepID=UPI00341584F2